MSSQIKNDFAERILNVYKAKTNNFLELVKIAKYDIKNDFMGSDLSELDLHGIDFSYADLRHTDLNKSSLAKAIFINAKLNSADLSGADLSQSDLSGADLSCTDSEQIYEDDIYESGIFESPTNLSKSTLYKATLINTLLQNIICIEANLEGANLNGANLEGANLEGANLNGANLEGANLNGANLEGANLEGANLEGANLEGANLQDTKLQGTNFKDAYIHNAIFEGANLQESSFESAIGGPSKIDKNEKWEILEPLFGEKGKILIFAPDSVPNSKLDELSDALIYLCEGILAILDENITSITDLSDQAKWQKHLDYIANKSDRVLRSKTSRPNTISINVDAKVAATIGILFSLFRDKLLFNKQYELIKFLNEMLDFQKKYIDAGRECNQAEKDAIFKEIEFVLNIVKDTDLDDDIRQEAKNYFFTCIQKLRSFDVKIDHFQTRFEAASAFFHKNVSKLSIPLKQVDAKVYRDGKQIFPSPHMN